MKVPFYISRRYLFAKKSNNLINIITKISVTVIAVTSAALVLILSVMNGMSDLVNQLYSNFSPDIVIQPSQGKTFELTDLPSSEIESLDFVASFIPTSETVVLLKYQDQQEVATLKGVSNDYFVASGLQNHMNFKGKVQSGAQSFSVLGLGLAYRLGMPANINSSMTVFAPGKQKGSVLDAANYFRSEMIENLGTFSVNDEFDRKYALVSHRFVRDLLDLENRYHQIEIRLTPETSEEKAKKVIAGLTGKGFEVKTRFEQNEFLFKSINAEKYVAIMVLAFIMIIAFFNLSGSLIMLMIDKKEDAFVLQSFGLSKKQLQQIFFLEGIWITLLGVSIGVGLGSILVFIQNYFEIVKIAGSFVISAYPVKWLWTDIALIIGIVLIIGSISSYIPSRRIFSQKI